MTGGAMLDVTVTDKDREAARVVAIEISEAAGIVLADDAMAVQYIASRAIATARDEGERTGYAKGWNDKSIRMGDVICKVWPRIRDLSDEVAAEAHKDPEESGKEKDHA
jgi:hypothetical protein